MLIIHLKNKAMETKELKLENLNNCLACDAFIIIHFAPKDPVPEKALERMYRVNNEGTIFEVKIVDMLRIEFAGISSLMTLPATGLESQEWKMQWLKKYPDTHARSLMAVYFYKKQ
jgi:hypothetical protein